MEQKNNRAKEFISNPKKALYNVSLPIMVGMLVQTLYNIVDAAYIGRLGADAIAALTFSFPIFFLLIALNSGIGVGINSKVSRFLGSHNKKDAENTAMNGLVFSLVTSVILMILFLVFLRPLFILFGAENNVLKLSLDYTYIILLGMIFMFPMFVLNTIFAAQGETKINMRVQIIGLILNFILDPIFIFYFKLGVRGAAIATVISLLFTLLMYIYHLKKSYIQIDFKEFVFDKGIIKDILRIGVPASLMMIMMSLSVIFFNRIMMHFGTEYVAVLGITMRLESLATLPIIGFSLGILTLTGMFHGAKEFKILKSTAWYTIKIAAIFTAMIGLVLFIFPTLFLRIFTNDANLIDLARNYLRIDIFAFPMMAIAIVISRVMQGLGYGLPGLMVNIIRLIIVAVPLGYLFVYFFGFGYLSTAIAFVAGAFVSMIFAIVLVNNEFKKCCAE